MRTRRLKTWLIVPVLVTATVLGVAGTAQAITPNTVNGFGDDVTDDWGDNHEICWGCSYSYNTNIVGLWQTVLWADGLLPASEIDCQFGPKTDDATRRWQSRHGGLVVDGRVGRNTWGRADNKLAWNNNFYVYYHGNNGVFRLFREPRSHPGGDYWIHYWDDSRGVQDSTIVYIDRATPSFCS